MPLSIVTLRDHPDALEPVAGWIDQQWGNFSGRSLDETRERFSQEFAIQGLPTSCVALDAGVAVGVATLREQDSVEWDARATPWICNVYVCDEARGKGVGGAIGSAWAALFASHGLQVSVYDPEPAAESALRDIVARAASAMGHPPGKLLGRLKFTTDLAEALSGVTFVQESGPEVLELKQRLYADVDRLLPDSVVIASSTSDLPMSSIQAGCTHPGRTVVGHPINPPYAVQLVEVVGGRQTTAATIERACAFYRALGRKPLRLDRVAPGFVANRLQMALFREALQMVARDEATVSQIDCALMQGIGVRWAAVGIFGAYLLNLPQRDVNAWLDHFESAGFGAGIVHTEAFPDWSQELRAAVAGQWQARMEETGPGELLRERDGIAIEISRWRERGQSTAGIEDLRE